MLFAEIYTWENFQSLRKQHWEPKTEIEERNAEKM